MLQKIEINPKAKAKTSVFFFHGLGADGYDFVNIVDELCLSESLATRFIFPHAPLIPVTFANRAIMRAWFDIESLNEKGINKNAASIYQTGKLVQELIEQEIASGIPSKNIVIAGFSQGGAMALQVALRFSKTLGSILVLSGFLPLADKVSSEIHVANSRTPILMLHGRYDDVVAIDFGKASYQKLQEFGLSVTWRDYPMRHTVCSREIKDIAQWLAKVFSDV